MGKSIRSKRKKRLRTLKRELVEPHYDHKDVAKFAAQDAAAAAPKIQLPVRQSRSDAMEIEHEAGEQTDAMTLAEPESTAGTRRLKARGGIKKRGKSRGKIKKLRHRKTKLNF
ncbi:hypothetical protein O6H91_06G107800 [Diphasiastrum complanatum]|uniref:Uncharacterized protein n=1 Tax=Diphasiastrum complanatum TaxID=34168 RepID=A0ACC2DH83_DIPCM|nr:hypothetical protein O6H91_06G107800 [Diphasiastrum complanatum]